MPGTPKKTVIISGGTDGMGRAVALERLARGDRVTVIGSSEDKGRALLGQAGGRHLRFVRADLSSIAEVERVVAGIAAEYEAVDALALFANRVSRRRKETADGLESTFALYYLSRYLLSHGLLPLLDLAPAPVIVNVAGVGNTAGRIHWDDPQMIRRYGPVRAQLQAGRANDLLGVAFAGGATTRTRYVAYHPGFTRSGIDSHDIPLVRGSLRLLARYFARPVAESVRPIVDWIDQPPPDAHTAVDRGRHVDPSLKTLRPEDAERLAAYTEDLLRSFR